MKVVEQVDERDEKSLSSFEFDAVFDMDYAAPSTKSRKIKGDSSSKFLILLAF